MAAGPRQIARCGHDRSTAIAIAPRRVLVLYWSSRSTDLRPAIRHHLEAIRHSPSRHHVTFWNAADGTPAVIRGGGHDAVVLHNSFLWLRWFPDFARLREKLRWLAELDCLKIAMPQDEYDHSEILDEWLGSLGVGHVLSIYGPEEWSVLYPTMSGRAAFRQVLTGYIEDETARRLEGDLMPFDDRPVDVVYRANHLPYWFGSLGQLKHLIGERARDAARAGGMSSDISTRTRDAITGDDWFDFLASGRVVLGCESGSSVLDRRGEIRSSIEAYLADHPGASFHEVSGQMPAGWDSHRFPAISPRHFEAVITRTCQVLVEGRYNGILVAGRHYVPVRPDLSNLGDALRLARDPAHGRELADTAYEEIYRAGGYTYAALAAEIDRVLETRAPLRSGVRALAADLAARGRSQGAGRGAVALARNLGGRIPRRLMAAHKSAGKAAADIPTARLLAESQVLEQIARAQTLEPGSPSFRFVRVGNEASSLALSVFSSAPPADSAGAELQWPPRSIVVHGLYVDVLMTGPVGQRRRSGLRLDAVAALARLKPAEVGDALRPLLDGIGGARARPGLGGARSRLKTILATGRAVAREPRSVRLLASAVGRASLWETADDIVKLDLLRGLTGQNGVSVHLDPVSQTLHVKTEAGGGGSTARLPAGVEVKRIVWDNSTASDRLFVPIFGRRMTVFLGAAGVHEFTALEALPRSARDSVLSRLGS